MKCLITSILLFFLNKSLSGSISNDNEIMDPEETYLYQQPVSEPEERYFEQILDHFNKSDNTKWNQKYYREKKYYETGGPVYLKLAGNAPLNRNSFDNGYWHSHGKEKNAMFFYLSHRFYELKMPVNSAGTKKLIYLNASQVIEDCIEFIKSMNKEYEFPKDTKWILFGVSYAGTLAAWVRTGYPDLVHGAVASSAPVLARMNFQEYLYSVGSTLANYSKICRKDIALANKHLDVMVSTAKGRKDVGETFRLCESLDGHHLNISFFSKNVVDYISDAVLYDFEQAKVKQICDKMLENRYTKAPILRYSAVIHMLMDEQNDDCLPTNFYTYLQFLKSTHTRFALHSGIPVAQSHKDPIPNLVVGCGCTKNAISLDGFALLKEVVEIVRSVNIIDTHSINGSVIKTNELFGGLTMNTSRILFIHGDADPWHFTQITSNKDNKNLEILIIKGGSHCSDIYYEDTNKQEIEDTIRKIKQTLNTWLEK